MKPRIVNLERRYREMTDEELLAIAPSDLTQEARFCYAKEAAKRGLAVEIPEEVSEQQRQCVTVRTKPLRDRAVESELPLYVRAV